jgi:hypothetical protein
MKATPKTNVASIRIGKLRAVIENLLWSCISKDTKDWNTSDMRSEARQSGFEQGYKSGHTQGYGDGYRTGVGRRVR